MNFKDVSLFLCLCTLPPIILIGMSIRAYFDRGDYTSMIASLIFSGIILYMALRLYNNSKTDDNGGIAIRA